MTWFLHKADSRSKVSIFSRLRSIHPTHVAFIIVLVRRLPLARLAYAAAVASLPPIAANHITLHTYWRSYAL